jgi:TonB family protein
MQSALEWAWGKLRAVFFSSTFHAALLVCLVLVGTLARRRAQVHVVHPRPIARIDIAGGSHAIPIKLPPSLFAAHTSRPTQDPDASRRTIVPMEQPRSKMTGGGSPAAPHEGDGRNTALHGNGSEADDVRPAFPVFSPRPPVTDRSLLPATEMKIVVDVDVDAEGGVVSESLVKGMGNKLDQIVLEIVKTWRFQPATVNGKPVATQAELIFPFNAEYPITDS